MKKCIIFVGIFIFYVCASNGQVFEGNLTDLNLSDYLVLCSIDDPQIDECLKRMFQGIISNHNKGLPLLGIPSFEPIHLENYRISFENMPLIPLSYGELVLIDGAGMSDTKVIKVKSKITNSTMKAAVTIEIPKFSIKCGAYTTKNKYPFIPYRPSGHVNFMSSGITATVNWVAETEDRNGEKYLRITDLYHTNYNVEKVETDVDGITPFPKLNRFVLDVIQRNIIWFYDMFLKKSCQKLTRGAIASFYGSMPFRKFFL